MCMHKWLHLLLRFFFFFYIFFYFYFQAISSTIIAFYVSTPNSFPFVLQILYSLHDISFHALLHIKCPIIIILNCMRYYWGWHWNSANEFTKISTKIYFLTITAFLFHNGYYIPRRHILRNHQICLLWISFRSRRGCTTTFLKGATSHCSIALLYYVRVCIRTLPTVLPCTVLGVGVVSTPPWRRCSQPWAILFLWLFALISTSLFTTLPSMVNLLAIKIVPR